MKQKVITLLSMFAVMFMGLSPAHSATTQELERQISELSGKVENMRTRARSAGGGEGHSKTTVHGYGELHAALNDSGHNTMDQHRFVIGVHSQLSDWISLNAEIDFEHAGQLLEFEFGYLDFQLSQDFGVRAGSMLIPVGHINEFHEPNKFLTVERPDLHKYIIPTSWSGGGVGIYGNNSKMGVNYRLYLVNSVKSVMQAGASDGDGNNNGGCKLQFKDTSGIRSGRGELNKRCFDNLAVTGRAEKMLAPGVNVAYSFYAGNTTHGNASVDGFMFLNEADIQLRKGAFEMNSTIANISIADTAEINKFQSDEGTAGSKVGAIGERIFGWNIQAGVHLLQLAGQQSKHDLIAHVMYESLDTQADMDDDCTTGCSVDKKSNRDIVHFGLTYKPIPDVAIKLDHKILEYQSGMHTWDVNTDKKLDKDRFRKDLGNLIEAYQDVARRLGIVPEESNISEVNFGNTTSIKFKKK